MAKARESSMSPQVELVVEPSQVTPSRDSSSRAIKHSSFCPILSNFHAGYFRISLSLCGQALMWKTLGDQQENAIILRHFLGLTPSTALVFIWSFALFSVLFLSLLYLLRCIFHFEKVKAEFIHSVGVNYMFVPWISCLFLIQSCPFIMEPTSLVYLVLWWIFIIPIVILDLKIYGQWFTKGKRYLSNVANPTCLLSVIANFAGAWAAADMGNMESGLFMFALGVAHYLVLFVTLYQGYEGRSRWIGSSLKPVFFLFFAAPSMASLTWHSLNSSSSFDSLSKLLFYLSIFLCISLAKYVQEVDEEVQRSVVGLLISAHDIGYGLSRVCTPSERRRASCAHALLLFPVFSGQSTPGVIHNSKYKIPPIKIFVYG
ncbi:hypothetical protein QQ045_018952 [Rhodiola kirilowii]